MFTSGTSPLAPLRTGLWHFLLFAGVAWLAVAWSMLRLEPSDAARVAGPVLLFGAVSEALRALNGAGQWVLHCGLTVLFTATGAVLILDGDASLATPAALVGWYLLVRGAADIALSSSARGVERSWAILMVLGVAQVASGFYAASSYARSAGAVVWVLAAMAVLRAIADLVTAMDLRDSPAERSLRERAAGVAGYAAGLADYAAAATGRASRPRHRARGLLAGRPVEDDAEHAADMASVLQLAGVSDTADHGHSGGEQPVAGRPPTDRSPAHPSVDNRPGVNGGPSINGGWGAGGSLVDGAALSGSALQGEAVDGKSWHVAAFPLADGQVSATASTGTSRHDRVATDPASTGSASTGTASTGTASTGTGDGPDPDPAVHRVPAGPPAGMSIHGAHRDRTDGHSDKADESPARSGADADPPERARGGALPRRAGRRRSA